jgi:hypothetical protein
MTLVVLLAMATSAVAQEMVPVAPAVPAPVVAMPAPAVVAPAPVPVVTYYAPAPAYYYPPPAYVPAPWISPGPIVYGGGYTIRTRYFPYSVRTVVRAW